MLSITKRGALAIAAFALAGAALAQGGYPNRPVRMVVGFAASGGADTAARLVAQKIGDALGQNVVVENRTGAGGALAAQRVATASPDGHTLLFIAAGSATILPATRPLPYDMLKDFTPVSLVAIGTYVLVAPAASPVRSVEDMIAMVRAKSGKLTYGTSGVAGTGHIIGLQFTSMAKADMLHVPYKGGAEAVVAAAGNQVAMAISTIPSVQPLVEAGRLRALAVTTAKRSSQMPSVPTLDESGLRGFDRATWWGVLAPAAVPRTIVSRLNAIVVEGLNGAEMKATFTKIGIEAKPSTPAEFGALLKRDLSENAQLAKAAGLTAGAH
jgi:tripartite-type tricarboxylate transporter receptor subunit TctC